MFRLDVEEGLYECLRADLTQVGERQLGIVEKHLLTLSKISTASETVYARFTSLVQSSGFGKTKICLELLRRHPGIYLVFRAPMQTGIPRLADWMNKFANFIYSAPSDELPFDIKQLLNASAMKYTSGRFLVALLSMLEAYLSDLMEMLSNGMEIDEIIKIMGSINMISPSEHALEYVFNANSKLTIGILIGRIKETVKKITDKAGTSYPFLLFLDEADVFSGMSGETRVAGLNVIRRGLHLLDPEVNLMAVAIGTNIDALDLTPAIRDNSLRHPIRKNILPPLILSSNWDVMAASIQLAKVEMTRAMLLNRTFYNILAAMGRPMWASFRVANLMAVSQAKVKNGDSSCVGALVARLLIRANLSVNVHHVLSRSLVRSYMIVVNYLSSDAKTMKVGYSSEPILAFGAR